MAKHIGNTTGASVGIMLPKTHQMRNRSFKFRRASALIVLDATHRRQAIALFRHESVIVALVQVLQTLKPMRRCTSQPPQDAPRTDILRCLIALHKKT